MCETFSTPKWPCSPQWHRSPSRGTHRLCRSRRGLETRRAQASPSQTWSARRPPRWDLVRQRLSRGTSNTSPGGAPRRPADRSREAKAPHRARSIPEPPRAQGRPGHGAASAGSRCQRGRPPPRRKRGPGEPRGQNARRAGRMWGPHSLEA